MAKEVVKVELEKALEVAGVKFAEAVIAVVNAMNEQDVNARTPMINDIKKEKPQPAGNKPQPASGGADYSKMNIKELREVIKEKGIDFASTKKDDLIKAIEDHDNGGGAQAEDEQVSMYEGMTAKELYMECKGRKIEVQQKQPLQYYIDILNADDAADDSSDDWGDEEGTEPADDDDDWNV